MAIAHDEIHGHIQHPFGKAFKAEAIFKHHGGDAGAVRVRICPDPGAEAAIAVLLALRNRRIAKQRGRQRLQRKADAELFHHIRFIAEIEVHLHRAGAQHHIKAHGADARHILAHDLVATLRHPGHIFALRQRMKANRRKAQAQGGGDFAHLIQMVEKLGGHFMQIGQGRAGKLKLPAWFQADRSGAALQANRVAAVEYRLPALRHQPFQHGADALGFVRWRRVIRQAEAEFFMLSADTPGGFGLAAGGEPFRHLAGGGDGRGIGLAGIGHQNLPGAPPGRRET